MQIDGIAEHHAGELAESDEQLLRPGGRRWTLILLAVAGIAWIVFVVLLVLFVRSA
jgi:hypothetical protein